MDKTMMENYTEFTFNKLDGINAILNGSETTLTELEVQSLIDSGVEIAPYVEPVKSVEQLQSEAIAAMEHAVLAECRSGTGKLYFSDLNSAARHSSDLIQPDAEIRARAVQLLQWDVAIDAYALGVVFNIENGGEIPTIESFIDGIPAL